MSDMDECRIPENISVPAASESGYCECDGGQGAKLTSGFSIPTVNTSGSDPQAAQ